MASKQKKSSMKKETRSNSAKTSASLKEQLIQKEKLEELTTQNEDLQKTVQKCKEENGALKEKVEYLSKKIMEYGQSKGYQLPVVENSKSPLDLSKENLNQILDFITNGDKRKKKGPVELRVEELETRITHLNMELAKMVQLRLSLENGLEDIEFCETLVDAKTKARFLLYELKGNRLFSCLEQEEDENYDVTTIPPNDADHPVSTTVPSLDTPKQSLVKEFQPVSLSPPLKKLPGDTHIKNMNPDLRKYVIQNLSMYKGNGADWRMLGERVGIPLETIQQWRRWKVENPAEYVLQSWGQSAGATVRMLHRHLISPQMSCIILAKRISDFYLVE
uniref:Nuclear distribution protein nudE-like 1 n=1 Tax=Crassostrea virginica TaxID=6565 RepID=A0A8B8DQY3_CRAVI|nr:nuclear distribution protein nudE-like 1 [Crassostrea virginica]XP_022330235.1 nuclear distribution protein nudE-like 1 [Crassostrea virginica]XP_022330236.1 nuclear distribution protein nudE-like 1 [Crassostrea virginica]XP_022330238.1 nuclear distribution protein nudE-like 1 [Crassostrea virginica]XP_022330239.1 nuclear distribution protein nudE-like 1 [Crassostrea virginica]